MADYHTTPEPAELAPTRCGSAVFYWGKRTYIMGILNLSPDSFSGDGVEDADAAVLRAKQMAADGADIIDVGGESTRPGAAPLSAEEELRRIIPVVEKLRRELSIPLSVDTYKLEVARQAVDSGARMINDIWGLKKEPRLTELAAQHNIPIVLMSNQRDVSPRHDTDFPDILSVVIADLRQSIEQALAAGVPRENIIVDPGIGFGKTQEQNLDLLRRLEELKSLGQPVLLGSSRKSVIGWVLDLTPEQRKQGKAFLPPTNPRLEGTAATLALGIARGVDMVRVHDVKEMALVCRMSDALVRGGW